MTTAEALSLAVDMRTKAAAVMLLAQKLDASTIKCVCCETERNNNWPQKQLHAQFIGIVERMNNVAATLERRSMDQTFLGDQS